MKDRNKDRALRRAVLCICLVALAAGATLLLLFWLGSRGPKKAEALDGVEMESYFEDGETPPSRCITRKRAATPSMCRCCAI